MTLKRIFVIGATGPLGIFICREALKRGLSLHVFARNPSKLPSDVSDHANVKIVQGQITDEQPIISAIKECDIVISALGPTVGLSGNRIEPGTFTNAYRIIFKGMREANIKRIFVMGTPSIRTSGDRHSLAMKLAIGALRMAAGSMYAEVVAIGKLLDDEASDLDWTMYRLGALSNKQGITRAVKHIQPDTNFGTHRPGAAAWILDQAAKEPLEYIHQKPALHSSSA